MPNVIKEKTEKRKGVGGWERGWMGGLGSGETSGFRSPDLVSVFVASVTLYLIMIIDGSCIVQILPSRKLSAVAHTIHANIHTDINMIHTHTDTHTHTHTHTQTMVLIVFCYLLQTQNSANKCSVFFLM